MRKPTFWFPTGFGTNQALQLHKMARGLKLVLCRVAALKSGPVHRPKCNLYFTFGPLRSAEIFWEIRKYIRFRFIYSRQFKLFERHLDLYQSLYDFFAETWNYSMTFWLSLPVHSGSLKRIDYPKRICLTHALSFECFHCS